MHGTLSCRQWEVFEGLEQSDNGHRFTNLTRAQGSVRILLLQIDEKCWWNQSGDTRAEEKSLGMREIKSALKLELDVLQ